ncbi:translation initiation factor III [Actinoplanes sp. DH11]|uniref:translation initiation factor III n=1 Tax=Actinoplanes sp. DH11 TaxID=2857011 RepID=UPI001E3C68DD|nr:translation initiation factor III [Actinoplanes sp. DH11]
MARSKNNQRAANRVTVDVGSTGTRPVSKSAVLLLVVSVLAALWAVAMMTTPGKVGYYYFFIYAEFYMGVISLVSLSITIMVGLVATDRLVLSIRQRVLLQSVHRTTGLIAVSALGVHVWTKYTADYIRLIDIAVPFLAPGYNTLYVGLGTISGWIMVLVMWTGIARSRFIGRGKPWMWRGIHAISYLMWPIALLHGLAAGRPAPTWVIVSYVVCVLGVLVGLAVRLTVSLNRRKDFSSAAGTGIKPVGQLVPTGSPAPKRRPGRRGEPAVDLLAPAGPAANTAAWVPAAPPVRPAEPAPMTAPMTAPMAAPVSPAPMAVPVSPAPMTAEADYPPPRGRRPELEAPAPRQRRAVEDDERYDTATRAISRRDIEDERYVYDEEPAPRSRGGRAQEIYDAGPRRGRRYEDDEPAPRDRRDLEGTGTRMRRDDLEATGTRMRRDDLEATGTRMRRDELETTGTRMRRDELETTGTRMRRDDPAATGTRMRRDELEDTGARMRRYADGEVPLRARRVEPEYEDRPRRRRDDDYDEVPPPRAARYEDDRPARYEDDRPARYAEEEPPRRRERADGRHSRSQFVDLADGQWGEPDDSPTLVDMASRRSRRAAAPEPETRGGRRARAGRDEDDTYFSQLRGDVREAN